MSKKKLKVRRASPPPAALAAAESSRQAPAAPEAATQRAPSGRKGQFQDPDAVLEPDGVPYFLWREWWRAIERGDFPFIFALAKDASALRDAFGPEDEFAETCRRKLRPIPGTERGDLKRIRLHSEDEAYFFSVIDFRARERRDYDVERWCLVRGPGGWRVTQIDRATFPKTRDPATVSLDDFPAVVG
jgi:hypothetical protein